MSFQFLFMIMAKEGIKRTAKQVLGNCERLVVASLRRTLLLTFVKLKSKDFKNRFVLVYFVLVYYTVLSLYRGLYCQLQSHSLSSGLWIWVLRLRFGT